MANYKKVAEQILSTVGGAENVASVTHCMTRLRFNLKDESLSNDEKLEDISSIISVVHAGGQVQLVVGPTVDKVYDEVCKQGGFEVTVSIDEELDGPQLSWKERLAPKHLFNQNLGRLTIFHVHLLQSRKAIGTNIFVQQLIIPNNGNPLLFIMQQPVLSRTHPTGNGEHA